MTTVGNWPGLQRDERLNLAVPQANDGVGIDALRGSLFGPVCLFGGNGLLIGAVFLPALGLLLNIAAFSMGCVPLLMHALS